MTGVELQMVSFHFRIEIGIDITVALSNPHKDANKKQWPSKYIWEVSFFFAYDMSETMIEKYKLYKINYWCR